MQGDNRAEYGASIIKKLAKELTAEYGKGYTKTNLYHFYSFYKTYPEIFHSASGKLLLSWTHYRTLLQVNDKDARDWYEKEALEQTWSVATLQRNISSQYYYRMLQTQRQDLVENEMKELTAGYQNDKYEFIKSPVIAEFLGFAQNTDFTEATLRRVFFPICKNSLWNLATDMHMLPDGNISIRKSRTIISTSCFITIS